MIKLVSSKKQSDKKKVRYIGDQVNTTLFYGMNSIIGFSPGDKIKVPSDIAKELVEQGNYELYKEGKNDI